MKKTIIVLLSALMMLTFNLARAQTFIEPLRPIYMTAGVPVTEPATKENADIKFQYSLAFPIWNDILGSGIDAKAGFTQISVWNFLARSHPFYDNAYMPGIYFIKRWDVPNKGNHSLAWGYEHKSNGRDDAWSRSQNYLFITWTRHWDSGLGLQVNLRPGYGDYGDPTVIDMPLRYVGWADFGIYYDSAEFPIGFELKVTPIYNKSIANITAGVNIRLSKNVHVPDLYIQFHHGYDEALRDCLTIRGPYQAPDNSIPYIPDLPAAPRTCIRFGFIFNTGHEIF